MKPERHSINRPIMLAVALGAVLLATGSATYAQHGLQFNGSNQYVTFGTASGLGTATFTLETWFKRTGTGATTSTGTGGVTAVPLVTKGRGEADGNNKDCNYFFGIQSSDNVLAADFEEGATGTTPGLNHPIAGVTAIANDIWYHAAVTYDGNKWQLFLNGNLENELVVGQPPRSDCIQHAGLATAMTSTGSRAGYFAGEMDEVRIWNRALSQAEIQVGMGVELNIGTGLLGRWGLNENSGTVAYNSLPTGPNGTIGSSPTRTAGAPSLLAIPTATAASGITSTEFSANWNAVAGATDYRLDVSTSNSFDAFVSGYNNLAVAGTSQSVTGLTLGTTYYYRVRAVGAAGTTGNSNTITVATVGPPPTAPTDLDATAAIGTQINLSWTDNSDNELNFEIERSTDGGLIFDALTAVGAGTETYLDEGLAVASSYTYRVRATNSGGNSDWSNTASAATPVSPNNSLHLGSSNAYVTFGAAPGLSTRSFTIEVWFKRTGTGESNTTGSGGITLFPILAKGAPQAEGSVVDANYILGINATGYVLAADFEEGTGSTSPGLNHPISGATAIANDVWYHAAATFAPNGDFKLYLNGNLEASVALGGARWPQGASTQHAALGTMIESGGAVHGFFEGLVEEARIWNYARTQSEIQSTMNMEVPSAPGLLGRWGLNEVSGTAVQSSAETINGTVTGNEWQRTTGVPLGTPPGIPTANAATAVATTGFTANWNAVAGATSYRFDVSTLSDFSTFVTGYSDLAVAGITQDVTALATNTTYYYRVRAVGDGGTSGNSNTMNVTTLGTPPSDPSGLTATAISYRTIQVGWTDNSGNEEHFEVQRSTDGGSSFALLVSLGADVTSYVDATVGAGLPYCYRVRATNASGPSSYTSLECATTPAEPKTAVDLGASNAYVTFGTAMELATQNFTIEVWFKRTGAGTVSTTGTGGIDIIPILAKGAPEADGSNVDENYVLGIRSTNVLAADFEEGFGSVDDGLNHPISGSTIILNDTWYHAAATFAPNGDFKLYLNGNLEASAALGSNVWPQGASIQHAALGTMIESDGTSLNGFFAGIVDEARIWNVAHSQAEIQASMNTQITTPQPGLLGRYGFGEGSGTTVYCGAGSSINGTLTETGASWTTDSPFNTAPTASGVSITGTAQLGQLLTGHYTYGDMDGDPEGISTFRWLAEDVTIGGATATTYTLTSNEVGKYIKFEATPVAQTGASPGLAVQSAAVGPVSPPSLTITATSGLHGSISPSGSVPVNSGADQSFTMTPDPGYHLGGLVVDGTAADPVSPYVFPGITTDHTIAAMFAQDSYSVSATGPFDIDLDGDGTVNMRMNFTKLPAGGGSVLPMLYLTPPAGAPVPPSGSLTYYLMVTSTIPDRTFMAEVSVDMAGVTGFDVGTSLAYYNDVTGAWVPIPGSYSASDAAFGGHPSYTFITDHFTPFVFYDAGALMMTVFMSADPDVMATGIFYPNNSWGPETGYGVDDWSWTGTEPISLYIVPEPGLQFGACDLTLEWDATVLNFAGVDFGTSGPPNGLFGSGHGYPVTTKTDRLSTTNRVRINCAVLNGTNLTGDFGAYVARINFTLLKPGHSAVALIDADFRTFVDGGGATAVPVLPQQAEVRAYLGDVATSGEPIDETMGDGVIDFDDLVPWSYSYFSGTDLLGMENYMRKYDIGSAPPKYVFTLPTPDNQIDFEDLVIFSISYGLSATSQLPKIQAPPATPVEISLGAPVAVAGETRIPVMIEGEVSDLRALHLELTGQFESFLGAEKGTLTQSYATPVSILGKANGRNIQVDCAVLGLQAEAVKRTGELVILRFAGKPRVHLAATMARNSGNVPVNTVSKKGEGDYQPVSYTLSQNYPNPFNPSTTIEYEVPTAGQVKVDVYNLLGELVTTLVDEYREPGFYSTQWRGEDATGRTVGSGVYLYRLASGSFTGVRKMVLIK